MVSPVYVEVLNYLRGFSSKIARLFKAIQGLFNSTHLVHIWPIPISPLYQPRISLSVIFFKVFVAFALVSLPDKRKLFFQRSSQAQVACFLQARSLSDISCKNSLKSRVAVPILVKRVLVSQRLTLISTIPEPLWWMTCYKIKILLPILTSLSFLQSRLEKLPHLICAYYLKTDVFELHPRAFSVAHFLLFERQNLKYLCVSLGYLNRIWVFLFPLRLWL